MLLADPHTCSCSLHPCRVGLCLLACAPQAQAICYPALPLLACALCCLHPRHRGSRCCHESDVNRPPPRPRLCTHGLRSLSPSCGTSKTRWQQCAVCARACCGSKRRSRWACKVLASFPWECCTESKGRRAQGGKRAAINSLPDCAMCPTAGAGLWGTFPRFRSAAGDSDWKQSGVPNIAFVHGSY